jgi:LuxR family maltose regulon positive regulatory protein
LCAAEEGDAPAAQQTLEQAVRLAQPGGFIRVFVDLGPTMAELLERLARRGIAMDYIRQILDAFPTGSAPSPLLRSTAQPALVEPLTNRELEVMALLAQRLSDKEIAQRLIISERTAKRHTANIYQKLGVNNRREAVTTAIALGILPAWQ